MNDDAFKREKDKIYADYKERFNYTASDAEHEEFDDGGYLFNRLTGKLEELTNLDAAERIEEDKSYKQISNKIFIIAGILFGAYLVWGFMK